MLSQVAGGGGKGDGGPGFRVAGFPWRAGCGPGIAGCGQQGQEGADAVAGLGWVAERPVWVDGVAGAPAGAGAGDVPGGFQVGNDGLRGAFGDHRGRSDVALPGRGVRAISTSTCPCPVSRSHVPRSFTVPSAVLADVPVAWPASGL